MPTGFSIRTRLLIWLSSLLTTLLLVSSAFDYAWSSKALEDAYDSGLSEAAVGLARYLSDDNRRARFLLPPLAESVLRGDPHEDIFFRVLDGDDRTIGGEDWLALPARRDARVFYATDSPRGQLRVFYLPVRAGATQAQIAVAELVGKRSNARSQLLWRLIALNLAVLLVTLAVIWAVVGYALRPVQQMADQMSARSGADLRALDAVGQPSEVLPLVQSLNRLFGLIGQSQDAQRRFIEDAAHQLRTPLAGLKGQIDLAVSQSRGSGGVAAPLLAQLERIAHACNRLSRLATQLLTLSRADLPHHNVAAASLVSLPRVIDEVIDSFLDRALAKSQDLGAETETMQLRIVEWELRELISNLIDNAIRYSPDQARITVRCRRDESSIVLEVEDDGPGIALTERGKIFDRFHRVPGTAGTGSGLGLAIVRDLAAHYGGEVMVSSGKGERGTVLGVRFTSNQ